MRKILKMRFYRDTNIALLFLLPSLAGFALFYLLPFGAGFYYSLMDSPTQGSFVGLANYRELLQSTSFRLAAQNTGLFTLMGVPLVMTISLALALMLNRALPLRNWLRAAYVMPLVVPVASIVLLWQLLFDNSGAVNSIWTLWGRSDVDWMNTPWARVVVLLVYLWKTIGYNMILFLAGLQNIPKDYYEAAGLDGAGPFRKFWSITLVCLTPTTFFVAIMSIISSFKVFRETYLIAGDYPHESIYFLQHYMNNMFQALDYQKLTSASFLMAAAIILVVMILFRFERKFHESVS
ncbi:carbohydrate ABC transporter permease [Paenibacillus sp. L3-i20]|uniref:carbohydrate ABC transporter permease n=1 Tax=Paenibacillus sp. L3-i20 TaxID=2905833 RepID=UPI001EDDDC3D|nr:sugar ABC transporter permease [Paenibacillus sp. L3-i20]GKU79025.1 sugar ABC transporter permease [Paenibacillus sp. L3-i20]